jgi:phospholipase C
MFARATVVASTLLFAACNSPVRKAGSCDGPCPGSKINHVVIVVQENHTFDNYFGRWCTAPAGSAPSCTSGPGCCEAAPATEPGGHAPVVLTDEANAGYDPNHLQACEADEINGGKMDRFVTSALCGDARNVAVAEAATVQAYWDLAAAGALADRWFQPLLGASAANDMYLAAARFVFKDNDVIPDAIGKDCSFIQTPASFDNPTIGDLLVARGVSWAWYGEGYAAMQAARAQGHCPDAPDECGAGLSIYPCVYDPSDVPFQYYAQFRDNPTFMRDYALLQKDLDGGSLPQVAYVKALGFRSEHPGSRTTIKDGIAFVSATLAAVRKSAYADDTLVVITYDEGGGYFDHVAPPPTSAVDNQPYGTRIPTMVVGPFARKGGISHVTLEHSSLVRFVEWNWLGGQTGQLGARDAEVRNIGSLLDAAATGLAVPEE